MTILTKDQILQNKCIVTESVDLPDGDTIRIKALSSKEIDELNKSTKGADGEEDFEAFPAKLFAYGVVDEEGQRMFSINDIDKISELSFVIVRTVAEAITKLSGISKEALEEIRTNLSDGQS